MGQPQRFFAQDDLVVVLERYSLRVVMVGTVIDNDWVRTFELAAVRSQRSKVNSQWASDRLGRHALILIGGALLASGYAAVDGHLVGAPFAAVLVVGGFAFMHSGSRPAAHTISEAAYPKSCACTGIHHPHIC